MIKLYPQQHNALESLIAFIKSESSVFILKGYAGTGKTTIIKCLIPHLAAMNKSAKYMAPTGRAAKILRDKIGQDVQTIHKSIYNYKGLIGTRHDENGDLIKVDGLSESVLKKQEQQAVDTVDVWFSIKDYSNECNPENMVIIVDEASMISSKLSTNEIFHFGTDILLDDLLTFTQLHNGAKIIFIGDDAQLPPVGDNVSLALEDTYFKSQGFKIQSYVLTEVIRQEKDSVILENAMAVRDLINQPQRNRLVFKKQEGVLESISSDSISEKYVELSPTPTLGATAVLCFSNSMANEYNSEIRKRYFSQTDKIQAGDILQVVRNRYGADNNSSFFNGDLVKVIDCSDITETQTAPVWVESGSTRIRKEISLRFRDITIVNEEGYSCEVKIVDSLLQSEYRSLLPNEIKALYINFRMRHPNLKENSEIFKNELMSDPYFNALNVKYGYAMTVHKAQGGEWDKVFVDYSGRTGLNNDSLRWIYTASTRSRKTLYGVNIPNVTPFDKLKFTSTVKISKPAAKALSVADVGAVQYLPETAQNYQKAKCKSISIALHILGFSICRIECFPYKDRYYIATNNGIKRYDCLYNGAGIYTTYQHLDPDPNATKIIKALSSEDQYRYQIQYVPKSVVLAELDSNINSYCDDLGITITNIVEENYSVVYHFRTSGRFSQIKFYYNDNAFITSCIPSSDMGKDDILLNELIGKLS